MGKLHKIRKAYEQLPSGIKREMATTGGYYGWNVTFDKKGRATICESVGILGCRHNPLGLNLFSEGYDSSVIMYKGDEAHKPKRPYYFCEYLKTLGLRNGLIKKSLRDYTCSEKVINTYNQYNRNKKDLSKELDKKILESLESRRVRR